MDLRMSLSVSLRVIGGLVILLGAVASPAVAKHHHHEIASRQHGSQGGTNAVGTDTKGASGPKETDGREGRKDDGKGNTGELKAPEQDGSTKREMNGKGEVHGDDHDAKSAGSKDNPIDTSNTITGPAPFARHFKKTAAAPKRWTRRVKTASKSPAKHNYVRNAIGQRVVLKQATADPKGHGGKTDDPPTVNGIRGSTNAPTSGMGAAAPNLHPKPVVLVWSLGRPRDGPSGMAAYRAALTRLNGLGTIRVGAGTGALGGGANLNSGVLSGNSFHPKQR
jgi:hypothetical protein